MFLLLFCFRLQEKISTMESEEKVQRQALLSTPVKSMSEHLSIPIAPKVHVMDWLENDGSYYWNSFFFFTQFFRFLFYSEFGERLSWGWRAQGLKFFHLSIYLLPLELSFMLIIFVLNYNFSGTPKCTSCY